MVKKHMEGDFRREVSTGHFSKFDEQEQNPGNVKKCAALNLPKICGPGEGAGVWP